MQHERSHHPPVCTLALPRTFTLLQASPFWYVACMVDREREKERVCVCECVCVCFSHATPCVYPGLASYVHSPASISALVRFMRKREIQREKLTEREVCACGESVFVRVHVALCNMGALATHLRLSQLRLLCSISSKHLCPGALRGIVCVCVCVCVRACRRFPCATRESLPPSCVCPGLASNVHSLARISMLELVGKGKRERRERETETETERERREKRKSGCVCVFVVSLL
jgi:hypothetical protein